MNMYEVWTDRAWFDDYPYPSYVGKLSLYIFAPTPGQAKMEWIKAGFAEVDSYTDLRARCLLKGVSREQGLGIMGPEGESDSYFPDYDMTNCYLNGTTNWPLHHVVAVKSPIGEVDLEFGDTDAPIIMSFDSWEQAARFADQYETARDEAVQS